MEAANCAGFSDPFRLAGTAFAFLSISIAQGRPIG
jgi:hypothetical protein